MPRLLIVVIALIAMVAFPAAANAQAKEGVLSEKEIEQLRDTNYEPQLRVQAYMQFVDDRVKWLDGLVKGRHHTEYAVDVHDAMDQIAQVVDELNDNLDEYAQHHRDVRKPLGKLIAATERWSTVLRSAGSEDSFRTVQRIALDNIRDAKELAQKTVEEEEAYFKEHPEALKQEKQRREDPHAPH